MSEPTTPNLWPGQVEKLVFDLEQVKTLASPIRALVFWTLSIYTPKSASDLADEIGKAPSTVRYHLSALQNLGLIIAVDSRKRRSRVETLYVRIARLSVDRGPEGDEIYNRYRQRAFKLEMQHVVRQSSYFFGWLEREPEARLLRMYRRRRLILTYERANQFKEDVIRLLQEAEADQTTRELGGVEVHGVMFMTPTLHQTRLWAEAHGISFESLNRDGLLDGGEEPEDDDETGISAGIGHELK